MTLSKVSFSDILRNDYWGHFDTFGENFDFDTFKNDTFEIETFERDRLPLRLTLHEKIQGFILSQVFYTVQKIRYALFKKP